MKTILTLSFWLTVILSVPTGIASAQDSTRVPDVNADANASVDATVHADVHAGTDEQSKQQPQPPGQTNKHQQKGATKWTLQPSDETPSTRFKPIQSTTKPTLTPDTERSDSNALFNPLTRVETPPEGESARGEKQSQGVSSGRASQPLGSKPQPDAQSAAHQKLLDSLNDNVPPPSSKTWTSSVNAYPHKSTGPGATSATATPRKKPETTSQQPSQSGLSKPGDSKPGSLNSNSQKRKSLDSKLHDKPGSALDSRSSPN
jgi:hypothetical protein